MAESNEVELLQQRLKEALACSESLRNDLLLEREVSQELANRNASIQKDIVDCEERMKTSRQTLSGLETKLKKFIHIPDSPSLTEEKEAKTDNRHTTLQECIAVCQDLQKSLLTRAELAAERDRQAQAAAAAAAALLAQKEASDITHQTELDTTLNVEEKKEFETTEVAAHVPFEATSSTEPANHHETPDSKPTLSVTDGDDEATLSEDEELNRTRSESTAGLTRPRNYSIGARRNSSIFIRLPDLAGTSLIRKSSDAMNTSHLAANLITTSTEGDVEAPLEDHHQSPLTSSHKSRTFSGDSRNDSSIAEDDHHSHSHSHSQNTSVNYNNDSMDMNVSRFPLNESVFYDPMEPTSATQDVALFEHFIVVGASEQVAIEFAHQLQLSYDEGTLSTMFKNTFGGFFNRSTANITANPVLPPPSYPPPSSVVTSSSATTVATGAIGSQALTQKGVSGNAVSAKSEEGKSDKSDGKDNNRRLSFGRPGPPATPTATATTAAATPATTVAPDTVTPVRSAGVFSYFMRSPTGVNPTAVAGATMGNAEPPLSVTKKTPSQGLKGKDLDTIVEQDEPELPKVVLPKRRFIYGDDNSESGSSHASTDLLAAMGERGETSPGPGSSGALRSTLKRSSSGSSGTEEQTLDSPIPTIHSPSTQHHKNISPHLHPSNLTDMMNLEDPTSPSNDNSRSIPAWTQGFEITEVGGTELSRMFSSDTDSTSPVNQFDSENQPSMKEVNALSGTFHSTGGRVKEVNPAHLPLPPSAAAPAIPATPVIGTPAVPPLAPIPAVVAAPSPAPSSLSRWWSSSPAVPPPVPPPVPPTAPLDSPPKGIVGARTLSADNLLGSAKYDSTKSTATDDSTEGSFWFTSPPSNKNMANNSTHSNGSHSSGAGVVPPPQDVFVRGRIRSNNGEGYTSGPSSPAAPTGTKGIHRSVSSDSGLGGPLTGHPHLNSSNSSSSLYSATAASYIPPHTIPHTAYVPNPTAAALIASSDKKAGTATTQAEILYRYPYTVEPPPQEVSDFCMPLGGKINKLSDFDSGTMVQEILFGHSHSKRSSRCFIFLLEDKTLGEGDCGDEESGVGTNKLYGVCVLHPRLVKTPIQNTKRKNPLELNKNNANNSIDQSQHGGYNGTAGLVAESEYIEFESMVCYAFLTRFPLFDFFFQVIFDLINTERLTRLELAAEHTDSDLLYSRSIYEYLPTSVLEEVLARLTKLPPPQYNEKFYFHISPGIKPIESVRIPPPPDFSEHYMNSSEWALPTLLSWMPVETIIWSLSLLLGEAKIVVIGHDYGMVSCAVIGLLVLLRPLDWVSPVIPMLPTKLMDFVESPVPILVGITVGRDQSVTVESIFNKNSDPSNDGLPLAVLDVSKRELYMDIDDKPTIPTLCMPGADELCSRLKDCLNEKKGTVMIPNHLHNTHSSVRPKPVYTASVQQKLKTRAAHDITTKHLRSVAAAAVAHQQKLLDRRRLVVEMANRMSHPNSPSAHTNGTNTQGLSELNRQMTFGTADLDVSDEEDEDGEDEGFGSNKDPSPRASPRTGGIVPSNSTSNNVPSNAPSNVPSNVPSKVPSTSSSTNGSSHGASQVTASSPSPSPAVGLLSPTASSTSNTVVTAAPTAASSISAAFGKVLRPRGSDVVLDTSSGNNNSVDKAIAAAASKMTAPVPVLANNLANVANNSANRTKQLLLPAVNALAQIPNTQPQGKLVPMSKMPLEGNNSEEFLNRFILTQIFSEHVYRQSLLSATPPPVPSHPAPPVPSVPAFTFAPASNTHADIHTSTHTSSLSATSTSATAASLSTSSAAEMITNNTTDSVAAVAPAHTNPAAGNHLSSALHVESPLSSPASPDSIGSHRKSIPRGVTFSPHAEAAPNTDGEAVFSTEALALLSQAESAPRNSLELRRRSVDMGIRKSAREESEKLNSSQVMGGEGESEEE